MTLTRPDLERYVSAAAKSRTIPDERRFAEILADVAFPELRNYWHDFTSIAARREANSVPDWRSKEQALTYREVYARLLYVMEMPGASEAGFRAHVQRHILDHVRDEQKTNEAFRSLPWYRRWHAKFMFGFVMLIWISALAAIPLFVIDVVFHLGFWKQLAPIAEAVLGGMWMIILACIPLFAAWNAIAKFIRRRKV